MIEWWFDLHSCLGHNAFLSRTHTLRWMCRHTKSDMIWNEAIQENVGVTSMMNKMREAMFRWFDRIKLKVSRSASFAIIDF